MMRTGRRDVWGRNPLARGGGCGVGFTLIELLVVIAIVGVLLAILVPAVGQAKKQAKLTRVRAELSQLDTSIMAYCGDHGDWPLTRTYCEYGGGAKVPHWAELPPELAAGGYVPRTGADSLMSADFEDPFNEGRTYKYLAVGPGYHNGAPTISWMQVPKGFARGLEDGGKVFTSRSECPVKYVVWSVGTHGDQGYWRSLQREQPLNEDDWYANRPEEGLLVRVRMGDEQVVQP